MFFSMILIIVTGQVERVREQLPLRQHLLILQVEEQKVVVRGRLTRKEVQQNKFVF